MFSPCEWGALYPDFLPLLSSSSMPFCLSQLHITTEGACNKLVEKKNIILADGLGNFNAPSAGPNPLEPKVKKYTREETQGRDTKEGKKGHFLYPFQGLMVRLEDLFFIRQYPLRVLFCLGPSFSHTHLEEILDPFLSFLLF